ncbi:hypothetical protein CYY_004692 [Polysphondylium violaceum]|uniref:HAD family phosphatase n=1 Tax=Polysphondylium violaceum TaxID=133409 RepID=A0A8J4PVI2_9MYCE|nr:hypothetical protein CYY_004692 [Polysphondylium violaceum]
MKDIFLIFDCGGVLANDMQYSLIKSLVTKYKPQDQSKLSSVLDRCWRKIRIDNTFTDVMFYQEVLKEMEFDYHAMGTDHDKLLNDLLVSTLTDFTCFNQTLDVLKQVAAKENPNVHMCILSNHGFNWFQYIFQHYSFDTVFKCYPLVMVSCDLHLYKPQLEIFEFSFNHLKTLYPKADKQFCLFVDDKLANCEAAKQVGFVPYQFNSAINNVSDLKHTLEEFISNSSK